MVNIKTSSGNDSVCAHKSNRWPSRCGKLRSLIALLIALGCTSSTLPAQDLVAEVPGSFKVTVHQVLLQGLSTLDRLQGEVSVKVTVENLSETSHSLELTQIKASCEDKTLPVKAGRQDPLIPREPKSLEPGGVVTGWLKFSIYHASSSEPSMNLQFDIDGQLLDISINDALRKTSKCTSRRIGPRNVLGVISIQRPVDGFSVWVLGEKFTQLKQAEIERVVVEFLGVEETWAMTSNSVSVNSVDAWLQSAAASQSAATRLPFASKVQSPVQFEMLYVVQPSTYRRPAYGFMNLRKPNLQAAIAASLRDVFQVASPDEVEVAFVSPEAGIRQAAMETNLDRLAGDRLKQIYESAGDDIDQLKLLASELHRSASPVALQLLAKLARSSDSDVSQAAMKSIIRCSSEEAVPVALALWQEFEGDPVWETDFANAILKEDDYRFTAVLATYAERRLMSLTADVPKQTESESPSNAAPADELRMLMIRRGLGSTSTSQSSQRQMNTLPRVLRFLRKQNDREFEEVAVRQLLKISDPGIQDDVLAYILEANTTQIQQLVSDYIAQRLPRIPTSDGDLTEEERRRLEQKYAPRGNGTSSRRYSSQLFATIKRFPKPEYTTRLLELAKDATLSSSARSSAFAAAFHGATPLQIETMLTGFGDLSRLRRTQALTALSNLRHPRWLELAEVSLKVSAESAQDTLRLLQKDRSLEASLLMVNFLDQAREESERKAALSSEGTEQFDRQVASFTSSLYQVTHPEAQAYLNRLEKSPLIQFHNVARQAKYNRLVSSMSSQLRRQADQFRIEGDNVKAEELYRQILDSNPFDDSAMTSLASLCMRADRPKEAMEFLKQAQKVSPEDVETESFIALAMIRLGDVEGGLKRTEDTLAEVPDLQTPLRMNALYNTACAYSRASEKADDEDQRKQYVEKAFQYLHQSIDRERGFKEVDHALADPDLTVLHKEADWNVVIGKMKSTAEKADPQ